MNWRSRITKTEKQTHWINFNGKRLEIIKDPKIDSAFLIVLNCDYDYFDFWGQNRDDIMVKLSRRKVIPKEIVDNLPVLS